MRWRAAWPGERAHRFPDRLRETTADRKRRATGKMRAARRVRREAIRRGLSGRLVMVTVLLSGELYDALSHEAARGELRGLCAGLPVYYVLARGAAGRLHAHLIGPVELQDQIEPDPAIPRGLHVAPVWSLSGVLAYLSKPNDESAARKSHRRNPAALAVWTAAERLLEAQADRKACGYSRLPVCSGVLNVPQERRQTTAPTVGLLLACLETVQRLDAESAARLRERRVLLLVRKSQARRHAFPAPIVQPVCCWRAAGLPVRRAVPLLVGHARPPPQTSGNGLK